MYRGWWKRGSIVIGLIHHDDWHFLFSSFIGFALEKGLQEQQVVTKILEENYNANEKYVPSKIWTSAGSITVLLLQ